MKHIYLLMFFGLFLSLSLQGQNTVTILNRPTTVTTGDLITFNVSYTKDFATAKVLVKFQDTSTNTQLEFDVESDITANSGTVTLSIQAPSNVGTHYELTAQLLEGWSGKASDIDVVEVTNESTPPTGDNTLEIINTSSDPINNGTSRTVTIQYNLIQASRILVEVRDDEVSSGSNKIGQIWVDVPAGNDTVQVDLVVDNGHPKTTNRIQAFLFEEDSWNPITINQPPFLLVGKGDGTITYRGQPYEYNNNQNLKFEEDLGDGYYTNWFVSNGWAGDIQAKFGAAEQASWVDWDNNGYQSGQGHGEFDIKIQKYSWHNYKTPTVDRGYPSKIASLSNNVVCTATGQWAPNSEGRTFLNMTAWLYSGSNIGADPAPLRSDIIIHTWDNSGDLEAKYNANPTDNLIDLGTITSDGITYDVLKRNVGGYGEAATYNLVPANNPRAGVWQTTFDTTPFNVSLNMEDILSKLITIDSGSSNPILSDQWYVHGLEWTFIGSSGDTVGGAAVQDSKGKLTLTAYTIPDLNEPDSTLGTSTNELNNDLVFPNPFSDSVTYKYNQGEKGLVVLDLFSIDGRQVKATQSENYNSNSITLNTAHLSSGMYILKTTSGNKTQLKKLIKN